MMAWIHSQRSAMELSQTQLSNFSLANYGIEKPRTESWQWGLCINTRRVCSRKTEAWERNQKEREATLSSMKLAKVTYLMGKGPKSTLRLPKTWFLSHPIDRLMFPSSEPMLSVLRTAQRSGCKASLSFEGTVKWVVVWKLGTWLGLFLVLRISSPLYCFVLNFFQKLLFTVRNNFTWQILLDTYMHADITQPYLIYTHICTYIRNKIS